MVFPGILLGSSSVFDAHEFSVEINDGYLELQENATLSPALPSRSPAVTNSRV